MNRSITLAASGILVLAFSVGAETPAASPKPEPKVAATVNGEVITVDALNEMYAALDSEMRENYDKNGGKIAFLDNYIKKRLVLQEAVKRNFASDPSVQKELRAAHDSVLFDRYIRDVIAAGVVTDEDIRGYYEAHQKDYQRPEMIKARHIMATPDEGTGVVNTTESNAVTKEEALAKMEGIARQLRTRQGTFQDLATRLSEDGTATVGGDLGWFPRGKMVPEFEVIAFSLKKGELSHVVESPFGYHVILLEDRKEAGVAPLAEVRDQIRIGLMRQRGDQVMAAVNALSLQLRADSKVNVFPENF
ncbi:MAG TPA: peptidylprolyl isomerase [Thermoanaerobaculia bacterium]|nr:peptidylprolyl isomerase [Thermoanaerobaculia bacterium]